MTGCACTEPGFCERHQCQKGKHAFELCRTSQLHFQMWERGEGAEQITPDKTTPRAASKSSEAGGPGTELKRIIARMQRRFSWFNLSEHSGCRCKETARKMDCWGPKKCRRKLRWILDRLETEAKERKLSIPFRRTIARKMVLTAIRRAERDP